MGFINPWMLLGLAALSVPLLVHLVQREEHRGRKFPSLMFVRRIPFEVKRRRRLRDRALLALRCLALVAVVTAFAAPFFGAQTAPVSSPAGGRDLVFLLDRSYSMSHPRRWQQAVTAVNERIDALARGERAALVTFDEGARVVAEPTGDKTALRAALERTQPDGASTGYSAAFAAANRLLARAKAGQQGVVIVSDLQRSALDQSGVLPLGENVALEIVPVTGALGANATVVAAELAVPSDSGVQDALVVRVKNTGDAPLGDARLDQFVNGRLADSRPLALAAGEEQTMTLPLVLAADRPTRVTLEVGPDALPADDRYYAVLAPRRPVAVALIEPEHFRAHQGVFFEQALRLARAPAVRVERVRLRDVDRTRLDGFDVVVLEDVALAPGSARDAISDFVAAGGGVLAAVGSTAGAGWPGGGDGFLPGTLESEPTKMEPGQRAAEVEGGHVLWAAPGLERGNALSAARIRVIRKLAAAPGDRVLARLENGLPLLMERTHGAGRSLALATSTDIEWGTLALEPGFVPFAQAAVAYLSGRSQFRNAFVAGDVADMQRVAGNLPGSADWRAYLAGGGAVVVETPAGYAEKIGRAQGGLFMTQHAGIHQAHRADGSGTSLPFAVNVSRTESVLTAASPAELRRRIVRRAGPEKARRHGIAGTEDTDPFGAARWLLLIAGLVLMIETLVANRLLQRRALAASGDP